jgi:hypothetical protein
VTREAIGCEERADACFKEGDAFVGGLRGRLAGAQGGPNLEQRDCEQNPSRQRLSMMRRYDSASGFRRARNGPPFLVGELDPLSRLTADAVLNVP